MTVGKYLKDRRTGLLYGWNYEMSKLPYMKTVQTDEEGWNDEQPDPTYIDPDAPRPVEALSPVNASLEDDRIQVESEALARAAEDGQKELNEPPAFDEEGHAFLGYDTDDGPVYETDEERDDRVAAEEEAAEEPEEVPELEPEPEPEPKPTSRKKR